MEWHTGYTKLTMPKFYAPSGQSYIIGSFNSVASYVFLPIDDYQVGVAKMKYMKTTGVSGVIVWDLHNDFYQGVDADATINKYSLFKGLKDNQ